MILQTKKKNKYLKQYGGIALFSFLLLFVNLSYVFPQKTTSSVQTGTWDAAGTWDNGAPAANDTVIINYGHFITLNSNTTIARLIINSGGTLNDGNRDMTITENIINNGTYEFERHRTLTLSGPAGSTIDGNGEFIRINTTPQTNEIVITNGNKTILASANLLFAGLGGGVDFRVGNGLTVTNYGNVTVLGNNGVVGGNASSTWVNETGGTLKVSGTLMATGILDASATNNTIEYIGSSDQTIKTPSGNTYHHLVLAGSSEKTMSDSLTINGNLTIYDAILDPGANERDITIFGNWNNSGSFNTTPRQQRVTFTGNNNQSISNVAGEVFYRMTVDKSGGTLMLNNDVAINSDGNTGAFDLTMSAGIINTKSNTLRLGSSDSGAGTLNYSDGKVVGNFSRWVNDTATDFLYPLGSETFYRPAIFNATSGLTNGFITIAHIEANPGTFSSTPFTDVNDDYYNTYNDGYWTISVPDSAACTNFRLDLDGNGFSAFPIEAAGTHYTRIIKRESGTFLAGALSCVNDTAGCPNGVSGNVVSRNLINGLEGDYIFASRYSCTPPNMPSINGSINVCINDDAISYTCTGSSASTFTWSLPDGGGSINAPASGVGVQSITVDWGGTGGIYRLRVVETDACSNSDPKDINVIVHPLQTSAISGSNYVTEYANDEIYSVTPNANYTYTWIVEGGTVASGQSTSSITVDWDAAGTGKVSVVATPPGGCANADTVSLTVVIAVTYASNGNGGGDWSNASSWQCNCVPSNSNSVRILNGDVINLTSNTIVRNVIIESGGRINAAGNDMTISGAFTVHGVYDFNTGTNRTLTLSGVTTNIAGTGLIENTGAATDNIISITGFKTIVASADLTIESQISELQLSSNVTITNNGKINVKGNIIGTHPTTSRWTQGANAYLSIEGVLLSTGFLDATANNNTIDYSGAAAQNIKTPLANIYHHLSLNGGSIKTMSSSLSIHGDLVIENATLNPGANNRNINIAGNWTNEGMFNPTPYRQRVTFNGNTNQYISNPSGETFYQLSINKGGGTLFLNNDVNINPDGNIDAFDLTLTKGNINTQTHTLTLGSSAGGAGTLNRVSGQVIGKFSRWVNATATNFVFPVGTNTDYRPAIFNAASGLTNGFIVAEHISENPGNFSSTPFSDAGTNYFNVYNDGYWVLTTLGSTSCSDFSLSLDGTGFIAYPIEETTHHTRVLKRLSGTWQAGLSPCINSVAGCPGTVSGNTVTRHQLNGIDGDYAFISRYSCIPPDKPVISGETDVCRNTSNETYNSTGDLLSTFYWSLPLDGGTINLPASGVGVNSVTVNWGSAGGTYLLRVIENNGCTNSDPEEIYINVHPLPTSAIMGSSHVTEFAEDEPYSAVNNSGYTYTWSVNGGSIASGQGTSSITVNWDVYGLGSVSVVASPPGSCPNAAQVSLPVNIDEVFESNGTGGGNWSNPSTWVCNCIPSFSSSVKIVDSDIVTLTAATTIRSIEIENDATLDAAGFDKVIRSNFIVNGTYDFNANSNAQIDMTGTNVYLGGIGHILNTGTANSNTLHITKSINIASTAQLTIDNKTDLFLSGTNASVNNYGNITLQKNLNASNANSTWTNAAGSTLKITGALLSTGTLIANTSNNTIEYANTGSINLKNPSGNTYHHLTLSGGSTKTLPASLTVNGDLKLSAVNDNLGLSTYTLTLKGAIDLGTGGKIDATNASSAVVFNGSASQIIPANTFVDDIVYGISINNPNNVFLQGTLNMNGILQAVNGSLNAHQHSPTITFESGANNSLEPHIFTDNKMYNFILNRGDTFNINTDFEILNNFTIQSGNEVMLQAGKNLTVGGTLTNNQGISGLTLQSDNSGTASLLHNSNDVPATVQRYISGASEDWHFLSSPVSGQEISGDWTPAGTYGNDTGYDLYVWDEPNSCWVYHLNTTGTPNWPGVHPSADFVPGRGYLYSVQASNPTKAFAGLLNNGVHSIPLTESGIVDTLEGFNLIGNPYPSSIDWKASSGWTRSMLEETGGGYDMWIWNPDANNYGVFNSNSVGDIGTNDVTRYIAPMQGFFVKAESAGNISMTNDVRLHTGASNWFKKSRGVISDQLKIRVQSQAGNGFDEVVLQFGEEHNKAGAVKLFSPSPNAPSLFMPYKSQQLSVLRLTETNNIPKQDLSFKPGVGGMFNFEFAFNNEDFELLYLEDKKRGIMHNVKKFNTYAFNASEKDKYDRFVLHFAPRPLIINELPVHLYFDGYGLYIDLSLVEEMVFFSLTDMTGKEITRYTLEGGKTYKIPLGLSSQIVFARFYTSKAQKVQKVFVY